MMVKRVAERAAKRGRAAWPAHGWLGVALVIVCWPLNWLLPGVRTHILFFPLWMGYILTVDALVKTRAGSSLLARSPRDFALLFVASVPVWWLFELLNFRLDNWIYLSGREFGDLEYAFFASLSFSTVIPAVFETAELVRTCSWSARFEGRPFLRGGRAPTLLFVTGWLMLALLLLWPDLFYPFTWLSLILILDPLCLALDRPSLLALARRGNWRPIVALAFGALVCGFFWELWNLHADPKWIYRVPGLGFGRVFEMPILGYLGYPFFGLELYPFSHLLLPRPPDLRL